MPLKLFNTLTGRLEALFPLNKKNVLYYTCGPTVHDYAHIGNFRTFVFQDVLKRWLEQTGHIVRHVMNITDVDENTIERATRRKVSLNSLTSKYEQVFFDDMSCLNIKKADIYPKVSDNIEIIAEMVKGLHEKGHALIDEDGSYFFDINSFEFYGKLSGNFPTRKINALMPREDYNKPKNFLLWKSCKENSAYCFNSSIGSGIPGWHIECAALSNKYLGDSIDIHSGGKDLIFPHHENEIAEAESYTGKKFSNFWVHVEHLIVFGRKMSKSYGNFFTLRQIIKKGYDPRALRLLYLKTHYRNELNFDFIGLEQAQNEMSGWIELTDRLKTGIYKGNNDFAPQIKQFKKEFSLAMNNDIQTDKAIKNLFKFIANVKKSYDDAKISRKGSKNILETFDWVNSVLGLMEECV